MKNKFREIEQFKITQNSYSIPICEIEPNGDFQLQLDRSEWETNHLILELPSNKEIILHSGIQIAEGDLYLFWGENCRLYLAGKNFRACDVVHRKIGQTLIVKY